MSRRQRIVALLVAAGLVLFFVFSVGNQYRGQQDDLRSGYTRAVEWLGEWLGGADPVLAEDFSAPCQMPDEPPAVADGLRLLVEGSCVIAIAPADPDVRELTLRSEQELVVAAPAPEGEAIIETTAAPGEPTSVAVGPDGAEILLRCRAATECLVRIGAGDG